jgi:hypothetical protein
MSVLSTYEVTKKSGKNAVSDIYRADPNVFLIMVRNYNQNLVCFRGNLDNQRNSTHIESFWLDIDPKYKEKARKQGKNDDYVEFNKIDRYAYGIKILRKITAKTWKLSFARLPGQELTVSVGKHGISSYIEAPQEKDKPKTIIKIHHLFVHDKPALGFLWPTVTKIDIVGVSKSSKKKTTFSIDNEK